ncbi:MAG: hypothetical protein RLZZ461_1396 [Planctomycetota bacterium]|jgi:hypothetical protein
MIAALLLGLAGCTANLGPKDGAVAQAARVSALESEVATLRVQLKEATEALATARDPGRGLRVVDTRTVPWPDRVVEARGSAVRPGGAADAPAVLQFRVRTEDARGRFLQTTGPAEVVAATISDTEAAVEVGRWSIDADAWRDALREGLLGTAYAIDLSFDGLPTEAQFLLVRLELQDVRLHEPLTLESPVPVIRPLSEGSR